MGEVKTLGAGFRGGNRVCDQRPYFGTTVGGVALGALIAATVVPVAAAQTCEEMRSEADEVVCLATPEPFYAVGQWYGDFGQTSDEEVRELLAAAGTRSPAS